MVRVMRVDRFLAQKQERHLLHRFTEKKSKTGILTRVRPVFVF
jgi:hypothetical protein